jgi:hypothetical protein
LKEASKNEEESFRVSLQKLTLGEGI